MSYRYLGNKTKLTNWIVDTISQSIPPNATVADPMCGTAAVSNALALRGYSVIAADMLTFPTIHAKSRLLVKCEPNFESFKGYENILNELNRLEPKEGYFYKEFGEKGMPANGRAPRLYFSAENSGKIDAIRGVIKKLHNEKEISDLEHAVLLQNLLLAVNKVANISGTYGYFRSKVSDNAKSLLKLEKLEFTSTPGQHSVLQGRVENLASSIEADAIYLDPPYTKRQYAGNYHILETIACEDEPLAQGDGGLRPWKEQASAFCYKRSAGNALQEILNSLKTQNVFLSYTDDGQISPTDIMEILRTFGEVKVYTHQYGRYQSNNKAKGGIIDETLYHLKMG